MHTDVRSLVRRIFGNLAWLAGGKATAGIISLGYLLIATRTLGPRDYGVLVLVHAYVLTINSVFTLQAWQAVVRFGFKPLHEGRKEPLVRLLRFTAVIEIAVGVLGFAVAATGAVFFGRQLGWSQQAIELAVPYSIAVLAAIRATPAGLLQLVSRFDLLGWHHAIQPATRMVGALTVYALDAGLSGFLIAWLVAEIVECAAMWAFGLMVARRELAGIRLRGPFADVRGEHDGLGRYILVAHGDAVFTSLAPRVVPLVIGGVLGPTAAGLYSIAQRAAVAIAELGQLLGRAAFTEFARLFTVAPSDEHLHPTLWRTVAVAAAAILPVIALIGLFAEPIAVFLGGAAFAAAAPLMVWFALARMTMVVATMTGTALVAAGRPGLSIAGNALALTLSLPVLPWLLGRWGIVTTGPHALAMAAFNAIVLALALRLATRRSGAG
jgi:O-antigen/teichoic acid export membrane protein